MERKTADMFVSTCNYLNFMIDEITSSNIEVPSDTVITVNELMTKLFSFMNHLYRNNRARIQPDNMSREGVDNSIITSCPPMNSSPMPFPGRFTNEALHLPGMPFSHYGTPGRDKSQKPDLNMVSGALNTPPNKLSASGPASTDLNSIQVPTIESKSVNVKSGNVETCVTPASKAKIKLVPGPTPSPSSQPSETTVNSTTLQQVKKKKNNLVPDVYITKLFFSVTESILKGTIASPNMGIYCRVCDSLCINSWPEHIKSNSHIKNHEGIKKTMMYSCRLCKLCLYGSNHLILKYFEYHFKKIHEEQSQLNWKEALVEVECLNSRSSSASSSVSSHMTDTSQNAPRKSTRKRKTKAVVVAKEQDISGNKNLSIFNVTKNNELVQTEPLQTVNLTASNIINTAGGTLKQTPTTAAPHAKTNVSANVPKATTPSAPSSKASQTSVSPTKNSNSVIKLVSTSLKNSSVKANSPSDDMAPPSQYPQLDHILSEMLREWMESSIRIDVGYCSICNLGITSAFDWFSHIDDHTTDNPVEWTEQMCPLCTLKIFGSNHDKYFNLPNHSIVCKKITGKM